MSDEKIPNGWRLVPIKDFAITKSGGTPSTSRPDYWDGDVPWINSGMLKDSEIREPSKFITKLGLKESSATLFPEETVVIALTGATTGKVGLLKLETTTNQSVTGIFPNNFFDSKFLFYQLRSLRNEILKNALGSAQPHINKRIVDETEILLPPLLEQQRIVAKLDAVFGHLDSLREKLDRIPELLKNFRQQVLTQAVTGELTREWREGKDLGEWEETTLNDVIEFSSNGLSKRAGTIGEEVTVLRLADFKNGIRVYGNERTIILDEKEKRKYVLDLHDLLVIRVNGSADLAGLFIHYDETGPEEAYCDHFIRIKINRSKLISKFLTFITNSGEGRKYLRSSLSTSAGQNTINQKSIGNLVLNLPPIQEQEEIIKQVETLFEISDKIEFQYQSLKAKIEQLPQAVLAKAFRGELVGQEVKEYVREAGELGMVAEGS